mmetsp:Transcript_27886/g.80880  ORF Transcript_27886/g.80880 Transcript_27886/m.80880 type:complete len:220 (-) Transcript_27886:14-673(-)
MCLTDTPERQHSTGGLLEVAPGAKGKHPIDRRGHLPHDLGADLLHVENWRLEIEVEDPALPRRLVARCARAGVHPARIPNDGVRRAQLRRIPMEQAPHRAILHLHPGTRVPRSQRRAVHGVHEHRYRPTTHPRQTVRGVEWRRAVRVELRRAVRGVDECKLRSLSKSTMSHRPKASRAAMYKSQHEDEHKGAEAKLAEAKHSIATRRHGYQPHVRAATP